MREQIAENMVQRNERSLTKRKLKLLQRKKKEEDIFTTKHRIQKKLGK